MDDATLKEINETVNDLHDWAAKLSECSDFIVNYAETLSDLLAKPK